MTLKKSGTTIHLISPVCRLSGLTYGDLRFDLEDNIYAYDLSNRLLSIVNFKEKGNNGKDYFEGEIVKMTEEFFKSKFLTKYGPRIEKKLSKYSNKDVA